MQLIFPDFPVNVNKREQKKVNLAKQAFFHYLVVNAKKF